jgi:enterochelin esterase-like enzyme
MPKPLQFNLYLPPCFDPAAPSDYPLLVLLHGQSSDAGQWLELGLAETADRLIAAGQLPALLIALPYEEYSLRDPFATGFEAALPDELLPWLEQHYPLCRQRACRALGGISRGGAWALHLSITRPELFAAVGAHAAPPFYGSDLRLTRWLKDNPPASLPGLYLDVGRKDRFYRPIEEFHALLVEQGVAHEWQVNAGDHSAAYWSGQLESYLLWYGERLSVEP